MSNFVANDDSEDRRSSKSRRDVRNPRVRTSDFDDYDSSFGDDDMGAVNPSQVDPQEESPSFHFSLGPETPDTSQSYRDGGTAMGAALTRALDHAARSDMQSLRDFEGRSRSRPPQFRAGDYSPLVEHTPEGDVLKHRTPVGDMSISLNDEERTAFVDASKAAAKSLNDKVQAEIRRTEAETRRIDAETQTEVNTAKRVSAEVKSQYANTFSAICAGLVSAVGALAVGYGIYRGFKGPGGTDK